jgi:hypothetical protein
LSQLPTHENNPQIVRMARRKDAKVVALVEANISRALVRDDVHSGRFDIRSLRSERFDKSGTDAVIAGVCSYIDVQMTRIGCAIWCKHPIVIKIIEERIKNRIFQASGKISNQDVIVGTGNEETIDVVIEIAIKPSRFE